MDEHLLIVAEDQVDSTVEFFRKYMAGFLISTHETSASVCGSDYERSQENATADTGDLLCMMFGATNTVREDRFFTNAMERQTNATALPLNCTVPIDNNSSRIVPYFRALNCSFSNLNEQYENASRYPDCNDVMFINDTTSISFMLNSTTTNLTHATNGFQVDGGVRDRVSNYSVPNGASAFGRRHAEIGSSEILGATIFYNNQVITIEALISNMYIGKCRHVCIVRTICVSMDKHDTWY